MVVTATFHAMLREELFAFEQVRTEGREIEREEEEVAESARRIYLLALVKVRVRELFWRRERSGREEVRALAVGLAGVVVRLYFEADVRWE